MRAGRQKIEVKIIDKNNVRSTNGPSRINKIRKQKLKKKIPSTPKIEIKMINKSNISSINDAHQRPKQDKKKKNSINTKQDRPKKILLGVDCIFFFAINTKQDKKTKKKMQSTPSRIYIFIFVLTPAKKNAINTKQDLS